MTRNGAALLRYRFDDSAQLSRHLHLAEGRIVFFYGDRNAGLQGAGPVALEIGIGQEREVGTLRGSVLARVEGNTGGAWLQFPDVRLFRKLQDGSVNLTSRRQRRLACDLMVEIRHAGQPCLGRLLDISLEGAKIIGVPNLRGNAPIFARLAAPERGWPSTLGVAKVVRTSGSEVGVQFNRDDESSRAATGRLYELVQASWAAARDIKHSPLCCQQGRLLEPPFPHIRTRI